MKPTLSVAIWALLAIMVMPVSSTAQDDNDEENLELASYSRKGADTCLSCHDDDPDILALFRTKHAVPSNAHSPFGAGQLQCEACHGPGGEHAGRVRRGEERAAIMSFIEGDTTPAATQNAACLGCHAADTGTLWHSSAHQSADLSCASCLTVHSSGDAVLEPTTQNQTCFGCHAQQHTESRKPFAHPLQEGNVHCTDCHSPHGAITEHELKRESVNDTCYQCHAEKRGPFLWEHAPATEDCLTCHSPHGASQPGMLTQRAPLLCQGCHSQAGHPSLPQDAGGLAGAMPSPYLLGNSCMNCHSKIHGSNHPSGSRLSR